MTFNEKKFDELLLYVAELSSDDPTFGKTKLNKVLYYADFYAYGLFGEPITGATYQRRTFGPVPREISAARSRLVSRQAVRFEEWSYFGRPQQRIVALRKPDLSVFTTAELALVGEVTEMLLKLNGSEVSAKSHGEVGWLLAQDGETIPYESVFLNPVELTAEDIRRGLEIEAELIRDAA